MGKLQRMSEWSQIDADVLRYHMDQWGEPKRSTVAFNEFISQELLNSSNVIDMGAGAGAATGYLASQNPSVNFTAFDYSSELIEIGEDIKARKGIGNLDFAHGDWLDLNVKGNFDGCVSLQTLSWLPDYKPALLQIFES